MKINEGKMKQINIKIISGIIVFLIYLFSISFVIGLVNMGLSSLLELIIDFNIKSMIVFVMVISFLYYILKTS